MKYQKHYGFTAIELIIVVVIISVLGIIYFNKDKETNREHGPDELTNNDATELVAEADNNKQQTQQISKEVDGQSYAGNDEEEEVKEVPFYVKLWPFGPHGLICQHVAPTAYNVSMRNFFNNIGGCWRRTTNNGG